LLNLLKLSKRIRIHEGFKDHVYKDQLGNNTIGYGHLITQEEKFSFHKKYSKKILKKIFISDFKKTIKDFNRHYKKSNLPAHVQEVIVEMIFQLGINKVLKFNKFNKYIKKKQYYLAAFEMLSSKWYNQTPKRVEFLIKILHNNNVR